MSDGATVTARPFALIPEALLYADLGDRAKVLYGVLRRHADIDGHAFPTRRRLADLVRCSTDSVDRALAELTGSGWVEVQREVRDDGSYTSNNYLILDEPRPHPRGGVAAQPRLGVAAQPRLGVAAQPRQQGTRASKNERTPLTPQGGNIDNDRTRAPAAPPPALTLLEPPAPDPRSDPSYRFADFWTAYPRRNGARVGRAKALEQWRKLSYREKAAAFRALPAYAAAAGGLPKDAERWLRGRGWEDDLTQPPAAPTGDPDRILTRRELEELGLSPRMAAEAPTSPPEPPEPPAEPDTRPDRPGGADGATA